MNIEGSGELEDGTMYDRKLSIRETTETLGHRTVTKEVTEERIEIAGEVCMVNVVRIDGEMMEENVEDASVSNHWEFERKWKEINWRWARVLEYQVPGVSAFQDPRGEDNREMDYRDGDNRRGTTERGTTERRILLDSVAASCK